MNDVIICAAFMIVPRCTCTDILVARENLWTTFRMRFYFILRYSTLFNKSNHWMYGRRWSSNY